jgi:hypothetical protein
LEGLAAASKEHVAAAERILRGYFGDKLRV